MVNCPRCNKPVLGPDMLGFTADAKWFHLCNVPPAANDEEKPSVTSPTIKPLSVKKP